MKTPLHVVWAVMASLIAAGSSQAATRYVKSTASGASNGTSWTNAYTRLQDALAVALSGDQIWIASGTYKPSTTGDRTQSFVVPSGVGLYGGFNGTEATLTERTQSAGPTILSGDLLGNDNGSRARTEPTRLDNTYNVVRVNGASSTVTFDGLTIQSGHSETYNDTYDRGGGIHFLTSAPGNVVINNCIIRWNTARTGAGWADDCNHAFTVSSSLLLQNQAERGGASGVGGAFTIKNCAFVQNRTENSRDGYQWSGGLFISNATGQVINCVFASNYAAESGGAIFHNGGNTDVINCTFHGNGAGVSGQTLLNYNSLNFRISNSIIWSSSGGGTVIGNDNYNFSGSYTQVRNSLVQGGYSGSGTTNVISSDPLFSNSAAPLGADGVPGTADDGLRLGTGSPAINSGSNVYVPVGTTADISGVTRISGTVDMGAYETLPVITTQPQSITVAQNGAASFSVTATGTGTLSYQWQKDGVDIPGATGSSFTLASAKPWHIGDYTVKVTDSNGTVTSNAATLSLTGINSGLWRGVVAYYTFDGNFSDQSPRQNNLTTLRQFSLGPDRFGATNKAGVLNANSGQAVSKYPVGIQGNSPRSISVWVQTSATLGTDCDLVGWSEWASPLNGQGFLLQLISGIGGSISVWGDYADLAATGLGDPFLNKWNHIVYTYSSATSANGKIYLNGVPLNNLVTSGDIAFGTIDTELRIGDRGNGLGKAGTSIDDVRIYNRAMSASEVSALYAAENAPNNWRQTHFGSPANTGNAADGADPDQDGLPNLLEYALNLPPNAASRAPAAVQAAGGNLEYTYTRGTAAYNGGTTFQVEWSDDLTTWFTSGVVEGLLSDDGTLQQVKATLPAGSGGRRFVRLRVQ